ncbi:predicted protein [Uncinocarpus reesii 1704]|uniref:Uncharacterized protein n=1 Tax=Uncinocarpus reesii (strain UAMH 1704) TaxID=336963 RepID=C4JWB5_UNCRE|nr:uncharacterized protein UREG_06857 [Uncinocarpus reesii 1704]EEP81992.1 predicted protein [Uncinocarpus reesii 1704]
MHITAVEGHRTGDLRSPIRELHTLPEAGFEDGRRSRRVGSWKGVKTSTARLKTILPSRHQTGFSRALEPSSSNGLRSNSSRPLYTVDPPIFSGRNGAASGINDAGQKAFHDIHARTPLDKARCPSSHTEQNAGEAACKDTSRIRYSVALSTETRFMGKDSNGWEDRHDDQASRHVHFPFCCAETSRLTMEHFTMPGVSIFPFKSKDAPVLLKFKETGSQAERQVPH